MLVFLGLGLNISFMTISFLRFLKVCDKIYVDTYTNIWLHPIDEVINIMKELRNGADIVKAPREFLEGRSIDVIVEEAQKINVCIVSSGDPFIATTHTAILVEALKKGVDVKVIPGISIIQAAMSFGCLQVYKFGKIATIVYPKNGIVYEYPYEVLKENKQRGLHTVLLLEIDVSRGVFMTPSDAIKILLDIERKRSDNVLRRNELVVVLEAVGKSNHNIQVYTIEELLNEEFRSPPYTIIIPGKLHPIEEECLMYIHERKKINLIPPQSIEDIRILEQVVKAIKQSSVDI